MTPSRTRELLEQVAAGQKSAEQAMQELRALPFDDLGFARVDLHRPLRSGVSETVYGEGKTAGQIVEIGNSLLDAGQHLLVTRLDAGKAAELAVELPGFVYDSTARLGPLLTAEGEPLLRGDGEIGPPTAAGVGAASVGGAATGAGRAGAECTRFRRVVDVAGGSARRGQAGGAPLPLKRADRLTTGTMS